MNLVWFVTIGSFLSVILGEFGRFPFGQSAAVRVSDVLIFLALVFL